MAIYYPPQNCQPQEILVLKRNLVLGPYTILQKNESCIVLNVKGYGIDFFNEKNKVEFRLMNSDVSKYFKKYKVAKTNNYKGDKNKLEILTFTENLEIKNVITVKAGKMYYYEKDRDYYNLYDLNKLEKRLRISSEEFKKYCRGHQSPE